MKNTIAFFDFDGTITTKDTLLEFIKFSKGIIPFYLGFALNSPYLIAYKTGIISNQTAKEKVLSYFFKGMPSLEFQRLCDEFSEKVIPNLIRPGALTEINRLRQEGHQVVIVSASPENWIKKWADGSALTLIATRLHTENGKISGKIIGKNCYGDEKVCRIKEVFNLSEFDTIYSYGDSSGDKPMLQLGTISAYKPFRARKNGAR